MDLSSARRLEPPNANGRTLIRAVASGIVGLMVWEFFARLIAPHWLGFALWVFAMYGMARVLGGMRPFMGFRPVARASLAGHLGLGRAIAMADQVLERFRSRPRHARALVMSLVMSLVLGAALVSPIYAMAQPDSLVTRPSAHGARETLDRFSAAVRAADWVVFTEVDHAAAAKAVGMQLRARTVVLFGNPRAGTSAMQGNPTLAIDLPMRALVWEDDQGRVFLTRSTGDDIAERVFARHGITVPPEGRRATDNVLDGFVRKATE